MTWFKAQFKKSKPKGSPNNSNCKSIFMDMNNMQTCMNLNHFKASMLAQMSSNLSKTWWQHELQQHYEHACEEWWITTSKLVNMHMHATIELHGNNLTPIYGLRLSSIMNHAQTNLNSQLRRQLLYLRSSITRLEAQLDNYPSISSILQAKLKKELNSLTSSLSWSVGSKKWLSKMFCLDEKGSICFIWKGPLGGKTVNKANSLI